MYALDVAIGEAAWPSILSLSKVPVGASEVYAQSTGLNGESTSLIRSFSPFSYHKISFGRLALDLSPCRSTILNSTLPAFAPIPAAIQRSVPSVPYRV